MGENQPSLEVKAILECNDKLVTAFSGNLTSLSGSLMAKGFIAPDLNEQMFIHSDIDKVKASRLVEGVRKSIEIAPNKFKEFLKVLQKMSPPIHDSADFLSLKYIELNNARSSAIKAAAKDHDIRRQHDIVILLLAILICVMALVIMLQAQNIFVTLVIGIATMFILTAIVDAVCQNVLNTLMDHFHFLALLLGRTLGNFVPFPCPKCRKWSRVSSYGPGTVVKPPINCPDCHQNIFYQSNYKNC